MKKYLLILLLIPFAAKSQDSLWVTDFNMKAGTIRIIGGQALLSGDTTLTRVFFKWKAVWTNPVDNANVQIDSIRTDLVVWIYQRVLLLQSGLIQSDNYVTTFQASIQPHRNTNSYLDDLCTELENSYDVEATRIKTITDALLNQ